jgi:hypothetical protein
VNRLMHGNKIKRVVVLTETPNKKIAAAVFLFGVIQWLLIFRFADFFLNMTLCLAAEGKNEDLNVVACYYLGL